MENVATGRLVHCRLKGSVKRKEFVRVEDWVLVAMRDYESDTEHYDRKGEILLKYSAPEVRQLSKAGELPERDAGARQASNVVFVDDCGFEQDGLSSQQRNFDMPSDGSEDDESDEDEGDQVEQDAVRVFCVQAEELPSPTFTKKPRSRHSRPPSDSLIQIDFHHPVDFLPVCSDPVARTRATPARVVAPIAPPAPVSVTIRARVKFWDAEKGIGFATPEDKSQTKAGVDVKLTVECVADLKRPLKRDDVVEITIDPRHDRPYVLGSGLRKVGR